MTLSDLYLGTAMWGWTIDEHTAFSLLDYFYECGGRRIDTATNYPINKKPECYGLALKWITKWIMTNKVPPLKVLVKVGSLDNLGGAACKLDSIFLSECKKYLESELENSLHCFSIHWDNRSSEQVYDIEETVEALASIQGKGYKIGLSGLKSPDIYSSNNILDPSNIVIQCKENLIDTTEAKKYYKFFPESEYYAYGINIAGFKSNSLYSDDSSYITRGRNLKPDTVSILKQFIQSNKNIDFYTLNIFNVLYNPIYNGFIAGPSSIQQLNSIINGVQFFNSVKNNVDYINIKNEIDSIKSKLSN